jgi:hypothetical protein
VIEIKPGVHYICLWFLGDNKTQDWFGVLSRVDENTIVFEYRFRYYNDDDSKGPFDRRGPFDRSDEKNFYRATMLGKLDVEAISLVDDTVTELQNTGFGHNKHKVLIDGDRTKFITIVRAQPFVHARSEDDLKSTTNVVGSA